MAVRNPTGFSSWIDERLLAPGNSILAATPDSVLNDQVYVLDMPKMVVSWCGLMDYSTSATFATVQYFYVLNKDMCDVAGVTNNEISCTPYIYTAGDYATASGEVRLTSTAVASNTVTIAAPVGGSTWYQGSDFNIKTNGTEDTITVEIRRTAGTGIFTIGSLLIVAKET